MQYTYTQAHTHTHTHTHTMRSAESRILKYAFELSCTLTRKNTHLYNKIDYLLTIGSYRVTLKKIIIAYGLSGVSYDQDFPRSFLLLRGQPLD